MCGELSKLLQLCLGKRVVLTALLGRPYLNQRDVLTLFLLGPRRRALTGLVLARPEAAGPDRSWRAVLLPTSLST